MRKDILFAFCEGKKPKDLISKKVANPKTVYYYHSIYQQMKETIISEKFVNELIKLLVASRIKE